MNWTEEMSQEPTVVGWCYGELASTGRAQIVVML